MKILAGRPKDLDDASAILAAQGARMGIDLVRATLLELEGALGRSDLIRVLEDLLARP